VTYPNRGVSRVIIALVNWPPDLVLQLSLGCAWLAGYVGWSHMYFRVMDPVIRRRIGAALGVRIVWSYDARQYFQQGRYKRWHWGVADAPPDHVVFVELIVHVLCVAIVNVLAGLWCVSLLYVALVRRWPGALALYPCIILAIPIYALYWSGRYRPVHGRET
jgi:hypothetical protein